MQFTDAQKAARAPRIKALIDNPKTPFTAADQAHLEAQPDERLTQLEAFVPPVPDPAVPATPAVPAATAVPVADPAMPAAPATAAAAPAVTPAAPAAQPVAAAAAPKPKTEAEWLAEAPPALRDMVARQQQAEAARKATLVGQLKGCQAEYTEAELGAMDVAALERIARLAKADVPAVDYSGVGFPRSAASAPATGAPPPIDMIGRIAAKAKGGEQKAS